MEYPSSFFDDYDEQDDFEDQDSDDDFDESTLWEISNLLYSRDVSSMESFLPIATETRNTFVYDDGTRFEMEPEGQDTMIGMVAEFDGVIHDPLLQLPIRPLALTSNNRSKLWISSPTFSTYANCGLPQPDSRTWEAYVAKSSIGVRSKPRPSESLPVLTTSSLWTHPHQENTIRTVSSMWSPTQAPKEPPYIATYISATPSTLLWTPKANGFGKHTSSQTSANSQTLKNNDSKTLTTTATQRHSHESSAVRPPMLWAPIIASEDRRATIPSSMLVGATGNAIGNSFSASSTNSRKARANNAPLDQLMSAQLWSECKVLEAEHHWISESSVRPESPSIRSESSSGGSSPTSDTLSVKSSSTKASSIWGSLKSVQVSLSWNTKPVRALLPTTIVDSKESSTPPVSPPVPRPLPSKRDSKVLAFRDLFESKASVPEDVPTQKQPVSNRTSLVHLAAGVYDNNSALIEATSQGESRIQDGHLTPQTLEADLGQDIALCRVSPNISYDAAIRHPVFFTTNLSSSIVDVHPAAIGYVQQQSVARDESCGAANHPSIAPSVGESKARMWTDMPVRTESSANFEFLWSKDLHLQKSNKFQNPREKTTPRSQMWNPPQKAEYLKNTFLKTVTQHSCQDIFPHFEMAPARKLPTSRQLPLPTVNSSQLFEPRALSIDTSVHWLHSTSNMSRTPSPALMWEAPLNAIMPEPETAGMWSPHTDITTPSPTLFSNPHTAPWMKKKRHSMSTKNITSSELWRLSTEIPGNPKHWLVDRRASRVQFRY